MNLLSILVFYSYERDIGLFTVLKSALFAASGLILPHEVKFLEEWSRKMRQSQVLNASQSITRQVS